MNPVREAVELAMRKASESRQMANEARLEAGQEIDALKGQLEACYRGVQLRVEKLPKGPLTALTINYPGAGGKPVKLELCLIEHPRSGWPVTLKVSGTDRSYQCGSRQALRQAFLSMVGDVGDLWLTLRPLLVADAAGAPRPAQAPHGPDLRRARPATAPAPAPAAPEDLAEQGRGGPPIVNVGAPPPATADAPPPAAAADSPTPTNAPAEAHPAELPPVADRPPRSAARRPPPPPPRS